MTRLKIQKSQGNPSKLFIITINILNSYIKQRFKIIVANSSVHGISFTQELLFGICCSQEHDHGRLMRCPLFPIPDLLCRVGDQWRLRQHHTPTKTKKLNRSTYGGDI